MQQIVVNCWH